MRFSAFNFADMKKSTIWVLGIDADQAGTQSDFC